MLIALLVPVCLAALLFGFILVRSAIARQAVPSLEAMVVGAIVNFFDTLGIGSFAPTTAWLKFRRLVPDRLIPQTMLVGLTPPSMAEGIIFLVLLGVRVDPVLLVGCVIALLMGGLLGAPLVNRTRVWIVQSVVGVALVLAAIAYAMTNLHLMPGGGTASGLPLTLMIIAIAANFVFGVLLNFGVGNYAPTLVMLSLMGMDPQAVLPDHGRRRGADRRGREHPPHQDRPDRPAGSSWASPSAASRRCWSRPSWSSRCRSSCCAGW